MKDHDAKDRAEAEAMALEAHLRAFHATNKALAPLAEAAEDAKDAGGQKLRAMVLAIVVNNLINVFTKGEKHFNMALVAVFHDQDAREARKQEHKKATVPDAETLTALKSLFDALDKTMTTPGVKAKVSPDLQDRAAKLRKKYDDIVNGGVNQETLDDRQRRRQLRD